MITTTEVFQFNSDADRQAFIDAIIDDLGGVPEYATAQAADKFVVAVRLPDGDHVLLSPEAGR
jgi:hypothetical protein